MPRDSAVPTPNAGEHREITKTSDRSHKRFRHRWLISPGRVGMLVKPPLKFSNYHRLHDRQLEARATIDLLTEVMNNHRQ
jgi:hypothetical protein